MASEYFTLTSEGNPRHPILQWAQSGALLKRGREIDADSIGPVLLQLGVPIPEDPILPDHMVLPQPVISRRMVDVLSGMDIPTVQYLDAKITDPTSGDQVGDHLLLHVFGRVDCMDKEASEWEASAVGKVRAIDKLVLDVGALEQVELNQRLVFCLGEMRSLVLYHRSVVDAVTALKPSGVRFILIDG